MKNFELIPWHVYLVKVPYYEKISKGFISKARPCIFYKDSGGDGVFLTVTSNQKQDGTRDKKANIFQVEVKFQKYGLVKINKPIAISKEAVIQKKNFGFKVPTNIRRKIIRAWENLMVWPLQ